MKARTAERLRVVALAVAISAGVGISFAGRSDATAGSLALGASIGALSGLALSTFEIVVQGPAAARLRRLPLLLALTLRSLVYAAVLVGAMLASIELVRLAGFAPAPRAVVLSGASLAMWAIASVTINFYFALRSVLGASTLRALFVGRYFRPREEQRIVLFVDLQGSTQLAERLGNIAFHGFLNRVFTDITEPILESGGEIYRYVGDQVIVTWPFARGVRGGACVACVIAIDAALARRRAAYEREFGTAPRLRAALHAGPLIVGEMGDAKREIVLLGDTMNTTARIEEACRSTGHAYIASGALLPALSPPPAGVRVTPLGATALRGKADTVELFALAPA